MKEWWKSGAPWIWLNGGAVTISMIMVFGLLLLILVRGFGNFWPHGIFETTYMAPGADAPVRVVGELRRSETLTGQAMREAGVDIPEDQTLVVTASGEDGQPRRHRPGLRLLHRRLHGRVALPAGHRGPGEARMGRFRRYPGPVCWRMG
jgi:hypothetical protein